jgi:DNA helicase-2/ATP-dependent DNA helicase PcrA
MFARILRIELPGAGGDSNFTIYDREDQKKLIRNIIKECRITRSGISAASCISSISGFKNRMVEPEQAASESFGPALRDISEVYTRYQKQLEMNNALDFDDLLFKTYKLFRKHPEVKDKYAQRFKYIFVDEFQDTNPLQYSLLKMFTCVHNNVTVVGDDDQSQDL